MAINTIHRLDKIVLPAGVEFGVLRNQKWTAGISSLIESPAGGTFPMFRANQMQKPMVSFSTPQLDILLAAVGVGGAAVASATTYFKLGSTTGNAARASAVHQKVALTTCCVYWQSIHLTDKGPGEASVVIVAIYDGINDPFVYTGSVALATTLPAGAYFGAGPVKVNGVAIPGIQEITIDSGIRLLQQGDSSEEFDTFVGVQECKPSITVKTVETVNWSTILLRGTALDGANGILCYGRKWAANGSRVANATAQHISFTGLNGSVIPISSDGSGSSPVSDTLRAELVTLSDATAPLTVNAATAIT